MADFRALCAELVSIVEHHAPVHIYDLPYEATAMQRARTALAQPEPQGATDEAWQEFIEQVQHAQHVASREGEGPRFDLVECALALWREAIPQAPEPEGVTASDVTELFYRHMGEGSEVGFENAIAEALTRWGRPATHPEPVAPTDEELYELWNSEGIEADFQDCRRFARAYAARWGRPTSEENLDG